jgi:phosphatidyl-myo-inositol dimannoside synthase
LSARPRFLVLSSTFPRWPDDTEPRFVLDLCRQLLPYADIQVLAPHAPGALLRENIEGVEVRRFRYFIPRWQALTYRGGIVARIRENPWRLLQLSCYLVSLWWNSWRLTRRWKPDVIHAHWIIPQALVASLVPRANVALVCTSHGGDLYGLRSGIFQRMKARVLNRCQAVTVVSQGMVTAVEKLAPNARAEVIPMGTDLTSLFVPPQKPTSRNADEIVFVGRLVEKKGLIHLIDAMALLTQRNSALKLTIAGDGPLKNAIRTQILRLGLEANVTLLGSVPHQSLPAIYQRAVLAVFPFVIARDGDQEGFGLVIAEAMGCECAVIASDLPAMRQTIEPERTGILVPPGSPGAVADAIHRCLSDDALRQRLATAGRELVCARYDWPQIALRYSKLLQSSIHRG